MDPVTLFAKLTIDGLACEACDQAATSYVRDVAVIGHEGQTVLVEHSLHRFCDQHERQPLVYHSSGKVEPKEIASGSPFLGRSL